MQEKIKFLLTGGLNTFVGFLFYVFFLKVGFEYNVAIIFSTFCGSVFNYLSYSFGVFRRSLGWSYFVDDRIIDGSLVRPLAEEVKTSYAYHIVTPYSEYLRQEVQDFRDWLLEERDFCS